MKPDTPSGFGVFLLLPRLMTSGQWQVAQGSPALPVFGGFNILADSVNSPTPLQTAPPLDILEGSGNSRGQGNNHGCT